MHSAGLIVEREGLWLCLGDPAALIADGERFPDIMTTLGPWSVQAMLDFLVDEYPELQPSATEQWAALLASGHTCVMLTS